MNTLLNYPGFTFTKEQLLSYQTQGVKFRTSFDETYRNAVFGKWDFKSFRSLNYFVTETPENKALFERLAGILQKKPRVHAELIQAWALDTSVVIQYFSDFFGEWRDVVNNEPLWQDNTKYRIKPSVDPEVISKGLVQGISTCKAMLVLSEEV